jgi:hypothetical protein
MDRAFREEHQSDLGCSPWHDENHQGFVSSPGDVQAERTIGDRLIRAIAEELGIPISVQYSNLLRDWEPTESQVISGEPDSDELILCPYFWEYQRFSPEHGYQDQIPNTSQFDLVICILWSRLGTKLHSRFRMPDGSESRSGTEYEIAWAKAQRQKTPGVPALQVYRNRSQPNPPLDPPEKREEFFRQWDLLKDFFESWEKILRASLSVHSSTTSTSKASRDCYLLQSMQLMLRTSKYWFPPKAWQETGGPF